MENDVVNIISEDDNWIEKEINGIVLFQAKSDKARNELCNVVKVFEDLNAEYARKNSF